MMTIPKREGHVFNQYYDTNDGIWRTTPYQLELIIINEFHKNKQETKAYGMSKIPLDNFHQEKTIYLSGNFWKYYTEDFEDIQQENSNTLGAGAIFTNASFSKK
jgi:hypothetical protein